VAQTPYGRLRQTGKLRDLRRPEFGLERAEAAQYLQTAGKRRYVLAIGAFNVGAWHV
jgi:hypothetical protein